MAIHDLLEAVKPLNPGQFFLMIYFLEEHGLKWEQAELFVGSQVGCEVQARDLQDVYQRVIDATPDFESGSLFNRVMSYLSKFINAGDSLERFGDSRFANWGYAPVGRIIDEFVESEDVYRAQLYHHVASKMNMAGRIVLDVGCGLGGGTFFIKKFHMPKFIIGIDNAENHINYCHHSYCLEGLEFRVGDALEMPFDDEYSDIVVNVESSHDYPSIDRFLTESHRVLKKGGYLLLADLRLRTGMSRLQKQVENSEFIKVEEEDITPNVREARGLELPILLQRYQGLFQDGQIDREVFECLKFLSGLPAYDITDPLQYVQYMVFVLQKKN